MLPIQHTQLTFGSGATTLALSGTEQYSDQIAITERALHDLRVQYDPDTTNVLNMNMVIGIYVSDSDLNTAAGDSVWHPYSQDVDGGQGNKDPQVKYYRKPAHSTKSAQRNANTSFTVGAKKIRFGFVEKGSDDAAPGNYGDITAAYLTSRAL